METRIVSESPVTTIGEGPLWDPASGRIYWIDVFASIVHSSTLDGREHRETRFPGPNISSLVLRESGGALVCSVDQVHLFDLDTGEAELAFDAQIGDFCGFNDGVVDRQGRFITGAADGALMGYVREGGQVVEPSINLYRIDSDLSAHIIGGRIGITNGPCFAPDGATLYCNDSAARITYAWDYDTSTGVASNRRTIIEFENGQAIPDGATVDSEGYLWMAAFDGAEIRRYSPEGELDRRIPLPVSSPTSLTFAGPDLDVLVVTTRAGSDQTHDGHVLALHGLGVTGVPDRRFAG